MKEVKRIADVGETIKVVNISEEQWERAGLWKNPHPLGSEWVVKRVFTDNCVPPGAVLVEGSEYGIGVDNYVVLEN